MSYFDRELFCSEINCSLVPFWFLLRVYGRVATWIERLTAEQNINGSNRTEPLDQM